MTGPIPTQYITFDKHEVKPTNRDWSEIGRIRISHFLFLGGGCSTCSAWLSWRAPESFEKPLCSAGQLWEALGGPREFWEGLANAALPIYIPYIYHIYIYTSLQMLLYQYRFLGFYFIFDRFGILRWIRSGHGIQNTFVNCKFHCFTVLVAVSIILPSIVPSWAE